MYTSPVAPHKIGISRNKVDVTEVVSGNIAYLMPLTYTKNKGI